MLSKQTCEECSRGILTIALAVIVSSLAYSKIAYAVCTFPPPTYHKLCTFISYWEALDKEPKIGTEQAAQFSHKKWEEAL